MVQLYTAPPKATSSRRPTVPDTAPSPRPSAPVWCRCSTTGSATRSTRGRAAVTGAGLHRRQRRHLEEHPEHDGRGDGHDRVRPQLRRTCPPRRIGIGRRDRSARDVAVLPPRGSQQDQRPAEDDGEYLLDRPVPPHATATASAIAPPPIRATRAGDRGSPSRHRRRAARPPAPRPAPRTATPSARSPGRHGPPRRQQRREDQRADRRSAASAASTLAPGAAPPAALGARQPRVGHRRDEARLPRTRPS